MLKRSIVKSRKGPDLKTLLMIDNYDSFTFNLVQMFRKYELDIHVYRSDQINLNQIEELNPDYIVISPGPKDPAHAGISISLINAFSKSIPTLGVCLGMQCINEAFGGKTIPATLPVHGKTVTIHHQEKGIFSGIENPFKAALYHSLMVELNSEEIEITATSSNGVIMGLMHKDWPLHGVQFHPESFMTENGAKLIENFLSLKNGHREH